MASPLGAKSLLRNRWKHVELVTTQIWHRRHRLYCLVWVPGADLTDPPGAKSNLNHWSHWHHYAITFTPC